MTGLLGGLKFDGYIRGFFIIPVALCHLYLVYSVCIDRGKGGNFKSNLRSEILGIKMPSKRDGVTDITLDIDHLSNFELLQMERELFRITIEQDRIPRTITQQLKHVRSLLRERNQESAYD